VLNSFYHAQIGPIKIPEMLNPNFVPAPVVGDRIAQGPLQMLYYLTRLVVPHAVEQFNLQNAQYYEPPHLHCPNDQCVGKQPTHVHFEIDPETNAIKKDADDNPIFVIDYTCPKHNKEAFEEHLTHVMMRKQVHQHSFTCRYYNII
jgi:hypothetical protein